MSKRRHRPPPAPPTNPPSGATAAVSSRRAQTVLAMLAVVVALAAVAWWVLRPVAPAVVAPPPARNAAEARFAGSETCAGCHATAYSAWKGSQHQRAMQEATEATVLGDFGQARFRYAGVESTLFRRDGKYYVRTDGADGKLADFEIRYTFGVEPLQQYLVAFPDGRLQALSIAWDSRPKERGGQRWFHLYPGEKVNFRDELHWTRGAQNWNYMCADCHSTDVRKNYEAASGKYATTWKEISVGCESCHGPASAHLDWARTKPADPARGLVVSLKERSGVRWTIDPASGNAKRSQPRQHGTEIEVCAPCHSRRSQVADGYRAGLAFQDYYRPALLSPGLYHADGQQRDEVFIWGSFLQSRMHEAGVTCSDCHEPHGQKLRAPGNAVCATCHLAAKYDAPAHHHHAGNGAGSQCVDCHMPARTYMVVDPRRDHSLRMPRPDLSVAQGTPNACNGCHDRKDAQWAAQWVARWYGRLPQSYQRHAEAFAEAQRGAAQAGASLARLATDPSQAAIARASALEALAGLPERAGIEAARAALADRDALVRRASLGVLAAVPPAQRREMAAALLDDPVRTVRMEAAYVLADAMQGAPAAQQAAFERAAADFEAAQRFNADRPEARAALGNFHARRGRSEEAQAQLKSAIALDPAFVPAYANLADLLRGQGRDADAVGVLRAGLAQVPGSAPLHHALGLALVRLGQKEPALAQLQQATRLAPTDPRFAYVYAIGLHSAGRTAAALAEIERALASRPSDRELLMAAVTMRRDTGDAAGAREQAGRLLQRRAGDPDAQRLAREVGALR